MAGAAPGALAIEKCVAGDGSVSYVDRCPAGSKRVPSDTDPRPPAQHKGTSVVKPDPLKGFTPVPGTQVEAPAPGTPPASTPDSDPVRITYYEVQGSDHPALARALDARGAHARSSWRLAYEYKPLRRSGGCRAGAVSTRLELALTLPRWVPPPGTEPGLVERWRNYVEALRRHEDRRLDHARALERKLGHTLASLPAADSCEALDAAARQRYEALLEETRALDAQYDARARRGETRLPSF